MRTPLSGNAQPLIPNDAPSILACERAGVLNGVQGVMDYLEELGVVTERPFFSRFPSRLCGNEIVAIRHSYFREGRGIEDVSLLDDVVAIEHIGGSRVDFVRAERSRLRLRHSAVNEVPNRRRKRYEAESDFHRLSIPERYNPASQTAAVAVCPMTRCAPLGKEDCALS